MSNAESSYLRSTVLIQQFRLLSGVVKNATRLRFSVTLVDGRKHEDFEAPRHMVIDYEPCEKVPRKNGVGRNADGGYQQAEQRSQGRNAERHLSHWSLCRN